jgi:anti-sigma factor RsiW
MKRPAAGRRLGPASGRAHRPGDPECGAMVEFLSDYIDGDLDAALRKAIDAHGGHCPPCRAFVRTLKATVEVVRKLPRRPLRRETVRNLARALRRAAEDR